jgi:hypothetical protein
MNTWPPTTCLLRIVFSVLTVRTLAQRILQRIQPPLNILVGNGHLAEHPLQFPLPSIGSLTQRRNLCIPLRQVAGELPDQLHCAHTGY